MTRQRPASVSKLPPVWARRPSDPVGAWADRWLTAAPAVLPLFGSQEWQQADEVTRVASCVRAALAWLDHSSPERVEEDLRREMAERDAEVASRWKDAALDVVEGTDWTREAQLPSHDELVERRQARP